MIRILRRAERDPMLSCSVGRGLCCAVSGRVGRFVFPIVTFWCVRWIGCVRELDTSTRCNERMSEGEGKVCIHRRTRPRNMEVTSVGEDAIHAKQTTSQHYIHIESSQVRPLPACIYKPRSPRIPFLFIIFQKKSGSKTRRTRTIS
jgi:hypothetical protein